jgi:hypothetical protein
VPAGPGSAAARLRSLPVVVQHDVNAKAYSALPLCVVLGHGARWWFRHRFIQLCGYELESEPRPRVLDYCDSFAYTEFLAAYRVDRAAGEQLDLLEFLVECVDAGRYPVVMVDNTRLTGAEPPLREFLVYGFADGGRTVRAVGFGPDSRFCSLTFPAEQFQDAFSSGLARMSSEPRSVLFKQSANDSAITHVIQVLSAPRADEAADLARIRGQVAAYLTGARPADFDLHSGWWWYPRSADISADAPVRFGVATYDILLGYLRLYAGRLPGRGYPLYHAYFEHKKIMLDRLRLCSPAGAADPLARTYEGLVAGADQLRLRVLLSQKQRKPLPGVLIERMESLRATETEILTAWLEQ